MGEPSEGDVTWALLSSSWRRRREGDASGLAGGRQGRYPRLRQSLSFVLCRKQWRE